MKVSSELFYNEALEHFKAKLPFVIYNKPNSNKINGLLQKTDDIFNTVNYKESGFIFAPFDVEKEAILIPLNHSKSIECYKEVTSKNVFSIKNISYPSEEENHIHLVEKTINEIKNSEIKKIVISRKKEVLIEGFDFISIFKKLVYKYPEAFCYVWYHPKVGLWVGATPETLLTLNNKEFETMALAGTQKYEGSINVLWGEKEKEEQALVTSSIIENIKPIASAIDISEVQTVKAGSLLHLKTAIKGQIENASIKDFVSSLHPTPAVCGLPMKAAKDFIIKNEGYNREFYTGFLGALNFENEKTELFVNLRCMQYVENKKLALYVGGGITKDSNATLEWDETENKTKTMLDVLTK